MLVLPREKRHIFKEAWGTLFSSFDEVVPRIKSLRVYTVGDVVTHRAISFGLMPEIGIIDGYSMRNPCMREPYSFPRRLTAKNPPGTITKELMDAIEDATAHPPALIVVEGEEDLAVVPLVLTAPEGGVVLYGQPGQGVVCRKIDAEAKRHARELLEYFEATSDVPE